MFSGDCFYVRNVRVFVTTKQYCRQDKYMKKPQKIIWLIFSSFLGIAMIALAIMTIVASIWAGSLYRQQTRDMLLEKATLFRTFLPDDVSVNTAEDVNRLCNEAGKNAAARITVIMSDGTVIGDSDERYTTMVNHADRPEIVEALKGEHGTSTRYSYTLEKNLMYVAVPFKQEGRTAGVVRTSLPLMTVSAVLNSLYLRFLFLALTVTAIAAIMSYLVSRQINKPITEIIHGVNHFSDGELTYRLVVDGPGELADLAGKLSNMATQLLNRINTITEQRNETEAVLSAMREAVFAVDNDERIIEYNRSADRLFGLGRSRAKGKQIQEVIRNVSLQRFVRRTLDCQDLCEDEIVYHHDSDMILQAHGTQLRDASDKDRGAVFVFNNITQLKKLENMRSDFVANVSHELKTPITSIVGFIETLHDGAIDDEKKRHKFLDIIFRHSRRLNNIIDDLLLLSRIEQVTADDVLEFQKVDLRSVLNNAISSQQYHASAKNIVITQNIPSVYVEANASLLEQAFINIINNAIKYSDEASTVSVVANHQDDEATVRITDTGSGIASEHLERIFERFYRVDKGRSRELGGTGLGLSIVKHVVLAHRGRVYAESTPGTGTTFIVVLPAI